MATSKQWPFQNIGMTLKNMLNKRCIKQKTISSTINICSIILATICFGSLPSYAADSANHRYDYAPPKLHSTATQRAKTHKVIPIGQASFRQGVVIPVFGISIENPMDDGLLADFQPCTVKSCSFKMTVPAEYVQQLVLYQVNGAGMFLAPKTWRTIEAEMGANGSSRVLMLSPDGQQSLSIYNTSACVGCSLSAASLYFPEAKKEALANDFTSYSTTNVPVNKVPLNKYTVAFSYQLPKQYPTDGIAKFYGMQQDIVNFNQMIVSINPNNKKLATTLLNFYHLIH